MSNHSHPHQGRDDSSFRAVIRAPFVTARQDLAGGVSAGERGEIATILGLEQAFMVRFGDTLVRCAVGELQAGATRTGSRGNRARRCHSQRRPLATA